MHFLMYMFYAYAVLKLQTESKSNNKNQSYDRNSLLRIGYKFKFCPTPTNIITFELTTSEIKRLYHLDREGFTDYKEGNRKEKHLIQQM